jgi:AcrR family transcriptional regulator
MPAETPTSLSLPRGWPQGLSRHEVKQIQRIRVVAGMTHVVCRHGFEGASVDRACAAAGVSTRTFYQHFANREDCLLAVFDEAVTRATAPMRTAYRRNGSWLQRVRASLLGLLMFLDEEPYLARFCLVQSLAGYDAMLVRRRLVLADLAAALEDGRIVARTEPHPLTGEALVGAVFSILHARVLQPTGEPLMLLCGPLMSMIALPYLGSAAARRQLSIPVPVRRRSPQRPAPVRKARVRKAPDMRLTYRTMLVLDVISEQPGISSRELAAAAGIADEGQISKLLARLKGRGVIENISEDDAKHARKAWRLTGDGAALHRAAGPRRAREAA